MKALLLVLSATLSTAGFAEPLCSPLNHCEVKKIAWQKGGWKTLASMELSFDKFCGGERPQMQLEKDLGAELWLFPGDKNKAGLQAGPYAQVNLHTYKLTHVVAQASVPLDSTGVVLTHRLRPDGKEMVEVSCSKR